MPTEYNGTASGSHPPSATPAFNHVVKVNLPADGDPPNASTLNQPPQVLADWVDFLRDRLGFVRGVNTWTIDWAYDVGDVVMDEADHRIYRCVIANTGYRPSANYVDKWSQMDYSAADIQNLAVKVTSGPSGITCSHGASAGPATMLTFYASFQIILVSISGVPLDGLTNVDLNGCAAKFTSICMGGIASQQSGGYQYGGMVGVNPNVGSDPNACTVWATKAGSEPASTRSVSLLLFGT